METTVVGPEAGGQVPLGVRLSPADALSQSYGDMRRIARRILGDPARGHLLQPTELANESAIRLLRANLSGVADEAHLLAIAARAMRQILIDEARKAQSAKRNASPVMTAWPEASGPSAALADIDEALQALAAISPERAQIVELRFMLGLTVEETALAVGTPARTVKRQWQTARAWLLARLQDHGSR